MESLISSTKGLIQYVLGSPNTFQNHAILGSLAFLSALFLYGRMAAVSNMGRRTAGSLLAGVVLGFVLTLIPVVAADVYLVPKYFAQHRAGVVVAGSVLASLLVAAPLLARVQRTSYGSAAFAWVISLMLAAFIVVIARAGMDLWASGEQQGARVKARSEELEEFLESK